MSCLSNEDEESSVTLYVKLSALSKPKNRRGRPRGHSGVTARQLMAVKLYGELGTYEKVARVLGCTKQNVHVLVRNYEAAAKPKQG